MKRDKLIAFFVLALISLMGCAAIKYEQMDSETENKNQTICTDPRPELCTMDYRPVCGERNDGSHKTYSNGCNACSDHEVIGFIEGECKE